jgi:hypothetical protein
MTNPLSAFSQFLWEITEEFCPQIIVIDGLIHSVSTIGRSHLILQKLWLPSRIKLISWESVYEDKSIESVVIENLSQLEGIERETFQETDLKFIAISKSVEFIGANCFSWCGSLSSISFESGSRLSRIEESAFNKTGLIEIIVPLW